MTSPNAITSHHSTSIGLTDDAFQPIAEVITMVNGRSFISLKLDAHVSVILPGLGKATVSFALALGSELLSAAAALNARPEPSPEPVPVEVEVSL